jgi:hypothetical protein
MVTRNDKYLLIVIRNPVPERMIMIILISYVDIANWHKERKFSATGGTYCGYHYVIDLDGTIEIGKPIDLVGCHCKASNADSIGICYIGGKSADGKEHEDTRTPEQKEALLSLLRQLKRGLESYDTVIYRMLRS